MSNVVFTTKSDGSAFGAVTIVPSDTVTNLFCKAIYVGGAGTVKVRMLDGTTPTFTVPAGGLLPIQFDLVFATGTSASLMVGLY